MNNGHSPWGQIPSPSTSQILHEIVRSSAVPEQYQRLLQCLFDEEWLVDVFVGFVLFRWPEIRAGELPVAISDLMYWIGKYRVFRVPMDDRIRFLIASVLVVTASQVAARSRADAEP
jgi:hypothetical protein